MKPGTTVIPCASSTSVPEPASPPIASFEPTAMMRPSRTANACACGADGSIV